LASKGVAENQLVPRDPKYDGRFKIQLTKTGEGLGRLMATHIYQMSINYNCANQFASNILHFSFDDGGFTTTAAAARGLIQGWDNTNRTRLRNILSNQVAILSYRARAVNVSGGFEGSATISTSNLGNRTGNLMASGIGPVSILFPIGNAKQRGRIFWPGVSDTDCVDGILTAAYKAVLNTSLSGMIAPFPTVGGGTVTVQPIVYSRRLLQAFNIFAAQTSMLVGQVRRRQLPA
jgi:hypothetical protein